MPNDHHEITHALKRLFVPGDVFEIRALDATVPGSRYTHIESGYFDFEHIDAIPAALEKITARGVYFTPNPVNPALLARAANRIRQAGKDESTSDADILCRRWLLIDCDPVRPAKISSTNIEHELAISKAREIRQGLGTMGWPQPIMLDSGNGAQLMYRVDLPAVDDGLIQACLKAIQPAGDAAVQIDQTVHNPARIWRLPGTMNCKGDEHEDRVYRQAHVISIPEKLEIVPEEKLRILAQPATPAIATAKVSNSCFDLDAWIAHFCPDAEGPEPWKDGRRWVFPVCPFNPEHDNRSAVITQQPHGAIGFRCLHNSCSGNDWHVLRELKGDVRQEPKPEADLSGILAVGQSPHILKPNREEILDPGILPEKLLDVPGFITEVTNYSLQTAPYPNKTLAFTGALAMFSFLLARKVRDNADNRSNIYLVALANSGAGEDYPRKVNMNIAYETGLHGKLGDAFASGEGLEDAMTHNHFMLFQTDEIDGLLNAINGFADARHESLMNSLLKLYSASNGLYMPRKKAGQTEAVPIINPSLTLYGSAVPKYYYEALNSRMLSNGFFARLLIFEAEERGEGQEPVLTPIPEKIITAAHYWTNFNPSRQGRSNLGVFYPEPLVVPATPDAVVIYKDVRRSGDELYRKAESSGDTAGMSVWARAYEKVRKLALIYAASVNYEVPLITAEAVNWAWEVVKHQTFKMLFMARLHVAENPFHGRCLKMEQILAASSGRAASRSDIIRALKCKAAELDEVIESLLQQERIIKIEIPTKTKPAIGFKLVG